MTTRLTRAMAASAVTLGLLVAGVAPPAHADTTLTASEVLSTLKAEWRTSPAAERTGACGHYSSDRARYLTAVVNSLTRYSRPSARMPAAPIVRRQVVKLMEWAC